MRYILSSSFLGLRTPLTPFRPLWPGRLVLFLFTSLFFIKLKKNATEKCCLHFPPKYA